MRLAPFTMAYLAEVEAEQGVKDGGDQTPRSPASILDPRASRDHQHHEPPGEQSAGQRRAGALRNPKTTSDQGRRSPVRHNSRTWELPLELCDIPGERCECGAVVWTAKGGNITATYVAGKTKGCVVCGRQLRARYWQGYGPILAAAGPLRLLKATDAEWRKRQREVRDGGWQALPIPVEGGRHVYTTAPHLGDPVEDLAGELLASLLAMTNDSRRMRATGSEDRPGWRQAWQAFLKATAVPPSSGEYVGTSPAPSLPRARMAAEHFGLLVRDLAKGEGLVIRDVRESDPATWHRFAAMVGIRKWVPNEGREAA